MRMLSLTPFPHGTSAKCNKKTVFDTVYFAVLVAIREQAHIATNTTKATHRSGFLFALCSRDSGGGRDSTCLSQTPKALCVLVNLHSHNTCVNASVAM